jgi:hypothetical protein
MPGFYGEIGVRGGVRPHAHLFLRYFLLMIEQLQFMLYCTAWEQRRARLLNRALGIARLVSMRALTSNKRMQTPHPLVLLF